MGRQYLGGPEQNRALMAFLDEKTMRKLRFHSQAVSVLQVENTGLHSNLCNIFDQWEL